MIQSKALTREFSDSVGSGAVRVATMEWHARHPGLDPPAAAFERPTSWLEAASLGVGRPLASSSSDLASADSALPAAAASRPEGWRTLAQCAEQMGLQSQARLAEHPAPPPEIEVRRFGLFSGLGGRPSAVRRVGWKQHQLSSHLLRERPLPQARACREGLRAQD